jgi:YD repeat-containing protein
MHGIFVSKKTLCQAAKNFIDTIIINRSMSNMLKRIYSFLVLISLLISATHAMANERVIPRKMWYPGTGKYYTLEAAMSAAQSQWCISPMFGCSTQFIEERYSLYAAVWTYVTDTYYSLQDANGKVTSYKLTRMGYIYFDCPTSFNTIVSKSVATAVCDRPDPILTPCFLCGAAAQKVGNPIYIAGGVKQQVEVDYANASGTLQFIRTYRSDQRKWQHNHSIFATDLNHVFTTSVAPNSCFFGKGTNSVEWYCFKYDARGQANDILARRGNGRLLYFGTSTDLSPARDVNDRVVQIIDGSGQQTGLKLNNGETDATELYDVYGRITSATNRNGQVTTYTYSNKDTPIELAPTEGLLLTVADAFGHELKFTYNDKSEMTTMTDPTGKVYRYDYANGTLIKVSYPDGGERKYLYGESDKVAGVLQPYALTGIIDENSVRFATYTYDVSGNAISTEHASGVDKYAISYSGSQSVVTDPLGTKRSYVYFAKLNVNKANSTTQPDLIRGGSFTNSTALSYDANGNISSFQDFDGSITTYVYDMVRNLETKRVEGSGSSAARTISTEWHPVYRLPQRIAEPRRLTVFTYDNQGNMLTRTVRATNDPTGANGFSAALIGTPQVGTYTYDMVGNVLTAKGPRGDVNSLVTFSYDAENNLATATNAAGHQTTFTNYDANGRVGRVTDPNGLVTDFTYTPRGWLSTVGVGGELTSYEYDGVGQMTKATLPDGSSISYTYDPAHRLVGIADAMGNAITYTLDPMGNRTNEQVKDVNGSLSRQIARAYDALNRVKQITGAVQ